MSVSTAELVETGRTHYSTSYSPAPIVLESGEGVYVYDRDGNEYLDFLAGIAVNILGYGHPKLTERIQNQVGELMHTSNYFFSEPQVNLLEMLAEQTFADRTFLCNSGTEANEAAFKLARRYQKTVANDPDKFEIVSAKNSFHGRTMASITATGQSKYHEGFEPMLPGVEYGTYNDLESMKEKIGPETAAVIVEPIQGEGGVVPADPDFLAGLRKHCDRTGALLIFDEVQTGMGRTGSLFAYQEYGVTPDILTTAKGLGGGTPVGAMMSNHTIFDGFEPGSHASTFGGNPLVCAAATAVLEVLEDEQLYDNAKARGKQFKQGIRELADKYDFIEGVRGKGLMIGIPLEIEAKPIVETARDKGLLLNSTADTVLRFLPPLVIGEEDVEEALDRLDEALATSRSEQ